MHRHCMPFTLWAFNPIFLLASQFTKGFLFDSLILLFSRKALTVSFGKFRNIIHHLQKRNISPLLLELQIAIFVCDRVCAAHYSPFQDKSEKNIQICHQLATYCSFYFK